MKYEKIYTQLFYFTNNHAIDVNDVILIFFFFFVGIKRNIFSLLLIGNVRRILFRKLTCWIRHFWPKRLNLIQTYKVSFFESFLMVFWPIWHEICLILIKGNHLRFFFWCWFRKFRLFLTFSFTFSILLYKISIIFDFYMKKSRKI